MFEGGQKKSPVSTGPQDASQSFGPARQYKKSIDFLCYLEEVTNPQAKTAATTIIKAIQLPRDGLLGTLLLRSTMLSIVGPFHWVGSGEPPRKD